MIRLRWTVPAAEDLENIKRYLEANHPAFVESTVRTIYQRIRSLKDGKGRPGRYSGTRELVLTPLPYLVIYSVDSEVVEILRILHAARDRR